MLTCGFPLHVETEYNFPNVTELLSWEKIKISEQCHKMLLHYHDNKDFQIMQH